MAFGVCDGSASICINKTATTSDIPIDLMAFYLFTPQHKIRYKTSDVWLIACRWCRLAPCLCHSKCFESILPNNECLSHWKIPTGRAAQPVPGPLNDKWLLWHSNILLYTKQFYSIIFFAGMDSAPAITAIDFYCNLGARFFGEAGLGGARIWAPGVSYKYNLITFVNKGWVFCCRGSWRSDAVHAVQPF